MTDPPDNDIICMDTIKPRKIKPQNIVCRILSRERGYVQIYATQIITTKIRFEIAATKFKWNLYWNNNLILQNPFEGTRWHHQRILQKYLPEFDDHQCGETSRIFTEIQSWRKIPHCLHIRSNIIGNLSIQGIRSSSSKFQIFTLWLRTADTGWFCTQTNCLYNGMGAQIVVNGKCVRLDMHWPTEASSLF